MSGPDERSALPSEIPPQRRPFTGADVWVEGPDGSRNWGRYGAAGLLVTHPELGVLLQHRARWSHFGGTWGLPGGAINEDESAVEAAIREAEEEAGVPGALIETQFTSVLDLGYWSYTTVVARARQQFAPIVGDAESLELRWVPLADVAALPLHPGFSASWPTLLTQLNQRVVVVIDVATVVGSRPEHWWRDRISDGEQLRRHAARLTSLGVPGSGLGLSHAQIWPEWVLVIDGEARNSLRDGERLTVLRAAGSTTDSIVEVTGALLGTDVGTEATAFVVTTDRELSARVSALGAAVHEPGWLLSALEGLIAGDAAPDPLHPK